MRDIKYKNTINKEGVFNTKITDKDIVKQLDAICLFTNQNKTKYIKEAVKEKLNNDFQFIREMLKEKGGK